jgi:glucose/mannose-6-phosphate isomerase
MVIFVDKTGLAERVEVEEEINQTIEILERNSMENGIKQPFAKNIAKKTAYQSYKKVPTIYGFGHYQAVAHRWKTQFNENSKVPSKYEVFPELDHNEIAGWKAPKEIISRFSIILFRDPEESPLIRKRIEITKEVALGAAEKVIEVEAKGESRLAKMFSLLHLGDLASIYLAIMQGKDPSLTETINNVKREMTKQTGIVD